MKSIYQLAYEEYFEGDKPSPTPSEPTHRHDNLEILDKLTQSGEEVVFDLSKFLTSIPGQEGGEVGSPIDTNTTFLTFDQNGNLSKVEIRDGDVLLLTTTFTLDTNGEIATVIENSGGGVVTSTINRNPNGTIASITKEVN